MKKTKIIKVKNYSLLKNDLYYDNGKDLFLNDVIIGKDVFAHRKSSEYIIGFKNVDGVKSSYIVRGGIGFDFEDGFYPNYIVGTSAFLRNKLSGDNKRWSYFMYDFKENTSNSYSEGYYFLGYPVRENDNLFHVDEDLKTIKNLHLPTETTLWQFDSSELGIEKISKIMGVFGEVLVAFGHKNTVEESYLSSIPDLPIFFGISLANGSLLWQQDEVFLSGKNERDTHCRISLPFLNNETGKVIIFEAGQYIEMDALTGEICIWQNLHENPLSLNGLSMDPFFFDPCQVDESFIYFRTGIGESSRRAGVGVFDRKKQELVALEVLTDDSEKPVEMGPLKIQATKDKIYALDLKQTLHIFERE